MVDHVLGHRIVVSKDVLHGKARISGTRIAVYQILDLLAAGRTISEITSEDYYPELTAQDVLACVTYASSVVRNEAMPLQ